MDKIIKKITSISGRKYLAGIWFTTLPILLSYGVLDESKYALFGSLGMAIFGFSFISFATDKQIKPEVKEEVVISKEIKPDEVKTQQYFDHGYYENHDNYLG